MRFHTSICLMFLLTIYGVQSKASSKNIKSTEQSCQTEDADLLSRLSKIDKKEPIENNDNKGNKSDKKDSKRIVFDDVITYIQKCYLTEANGFFTNDKKTEFKKIPVLTRKQTQEKLFTKIVKVIETFFQKVSSWTSLKEVYAPKESPKCENMLYLTGARYMYYLHLMTSKLDGIEMDLCESSKGGQWFMETKGACYPKQAGSLTCTSDADIGLIGPKSGDAVNKYNSWFETTFGKDCENDGEKNQECTPDLLLDNNVYAFDLEFATPEMFIYNPKDTSVKELKIEKRLDAFKEGMQKLDEKIHIQLLDVLFALLQVKRNNKEYYGKLKQKIMTEKYQPITGPIFDITEVQDLSANGAAALKKYVNKVKSVSKEAIYGEGDQKFKPEEILQKLLESHVYASEAYHSQGALRTIVIAAQMKKAFVYRRLSRNDFWASMIENFGMSLRYLGKCKATGNNKEEKLDALQICFRDASKYLWRTFATMKALRDQIGNEDLDDPEKLRDYFGFLLFAYSKRKRVPGEKLLLEDTTYKQDLSKWIDNKLPSIVFDKNSSPEERKAAPVYQPISFTDVPQFKSCEDVSGCQTVIFKMIEEYTRYMLDKYFDKETKAGVYGSQITTPIRRSGLRYYLYVTSLPRVIEEARIAVNSVNNKGRHDIEEAESIVQNTTSENGNLVIKGILKKWAKTKSN